MQGACFLSGRAKLPSEPEQRDWETKRLAYKGPTNNFHEIKPDFAEYFSWLREFSGPAAEGSKAYDCRLGGISGVSWGLRCWRGRLSIGRGLRGKLERKYEKTIGSIIIIILINQSMNPDILASALQLANLA